MALTAEQFAAWLKSNDAAFCLLADMGVKTDSGEETRYVSSLPFEDSGTVYLPVLDPSSVNYDVNFTNGRFLTIGNISLFNLDGYLDGWLDDIWTNRAIDIFFGDSRWPKADFIQLLAGTIRDIDSQDNETIDLVFKDKLERLNMALSDAKLGGATNNKDRLIPWLFGEGHNIAPLFSDPTTLEHTINNGVIERIIEVRDNGQPVSTTDDLANGRFELNQQSFGKVTVDAQGDKNGGVYRKTIADIIERIVTGFGLAANRFSAGDIDSANFSAFNTANQQPIGFYAESKENILNLINDIADSVGAKPIITPLGKLQLFQLTLPPPSIARTITTKDIEDDTLHIVSRTEVRGAVQIGYAINWQVQKNLETVIPEKHKETFEREYYTVVAENATTKADYRLDAEPTQRDTYLLKEADALAEANRELVFVEVPRVTYGFTGLSTLFDLEFGQGVILEHPRFGLDSGKEGVVVRIAPDFDSMTTEVEVII